LEGVPAGPPGPSLSGSALGLRGQHLVQHAQHRPIVVASSAVSQLGCQPARLSAYVPAFRALHLHRLQSFTVMLPWDVLNEPLFFNRQISQPAASSATANTACPAAAFLTPQQKPLTLSAGITKVAHLWLSLQLQQPQMLALESSSELLASSMARRRQLSPSNHLFFRPPADNSFRMLRQASSTSLAPICNFNRPHQSLSLIPALSKSSLGTPLGLGGAQRTSQLG